MLSRATRILVAVANGLLREEGYEPTVRLVPRDKSQNTGKKYDGIILSFGTYMLVQGRKRRIALLQQLRTQIQPQGPILVSFFARGGEPKQHKLSVFVANVIRRALCREPAEIGEWLDPYYHHYFARDDISFELSEGGFNIIYYNTAGYGHAVGVAV
jgi:hypothetical protein